MEIYKKEWGRRERVFDISQIYWLRALFLSLSFLMGTLRD